MTLLQKKVLCQIHAIMQILSAAIGRNALESDFMAGLAVLKLPAS